jgi:hypothetical protein
MRASAVNANRCEAIPRRFEERVGEADQAAVLGEDRAPARIGLAQPIGPHRQTVSDDVTVEKDV